MAIQFLSSLELTGTITASRIDNANADTDKFLVSDGGLLKYRTGAELRSDIGAGTGDGSVTSVTVQGNTGLSGSGTVTTSGTITLTNTDRGSAQKIFKNFAVADQSTIVADKNDDTITFVADGGMTIKTDSDTDTITFLSSDNNTNNFVSSTTFNTGNGVLTLNRSGLSALTVDLDGRYLTSASNFFLDGITKSGNTLTFSVSGTTNQTYAFGSNAFNSTTIYAEPGIFSGGGTPTLATGVTAAEIRSLIGAGQSSSTGTVTSVASGSGLSGGTITTTGTLSVDSTVIRTTGTQSITGNLELKSNDRATSYTVAPLEIRSGISGVDGIAPRMSFHWDGVVASQIAIEANGTIAIRNNPGTGYEQFAASNLTLHSGSIVLGGTGRIQGIDTVSAATDAANKDYVDKAIAAVPQGDITAVVAGTKLSGGGTAGSVRLDVVDAELGRNIGTRNAVVAAGWMTVALAGTARLSGEIFVTDGESSDHSFIRIHWMRSYADSNWTVINCGGHSNRIVGVRVLQQTGDVTYGPKYLQVYVTTSSNYYTTIFTPGSVPNYGKLEPVTPVLQNSIEGYALFGAQVEGLDKASLATDEGIIIGEDLIVKGGDILLGGTGRIQGIDTVTDGTDAANKTYVDGKADTGVPAILSNGSTPSLNSGISAAEIRSITGSGTSSLTIGTSASTAKAGNTTTISSGQASAITANTAKTGITSTQASNITTNNAKTGISSGQASAITANTAKTGITSSQASAITANTAKVTDTGTPAILSNGSTPTLNSGISAAEVRGLIGAGTSSSAGVTRVRGTANRIAVTSGTDPVVNAITGTVTSSSANLATGAQIQTAINSAVTGVLKYKGTWNAETNTPTLESAKGIAGEYYIVSAKGETDLDGIKEWEVGDWAVFSDQATDAWQKIDNTQVGNVTGSGSGGRVAFWNGTSNVTSDAGLTYNGGTNALTITGPVTWSGGGSAESNSAYDNKITAFGNSGSSTKVLTLTQQDGGTLTTSFSIPQGDIISVGAGTGMTGGGASGAVTLNVIGGTGITANANDIAIDATVATLAGSQAFTNKTGNISQWTNDSGYKTTDNNTQYTAGSGLSLSGTEFANTAPNIVQTTITGNAGTATTLANARTIAGVSFNGSANISLNNNAITNGAGYTTSGDTTYSAGTGLSLTGTVFANTSPNIVQTSVSGSSQYLGTERGTPDNALQYWQASALGTKEAPTTDWYNTIRGSHGDPISYYSNTLAIKMTGSQTGTIYTQTISNGTPQGWNKFWSDKNDGASSGLDADLLDGQHGSYYYQASNPTGFTTNTGTTTASNSQTFTGKGGNISQWTNDSGYKTTDSDTNHYVTSLAFNTGNGILTAARNGLASITVDLDGRYSTSNTTYSAGTGITLTGTVFSNSSPNIVQTSVSGNAGTATKFSTVGSNYKGVTDTSVIGQMMWKNYGNNHTIFDASASTSPSGSSVDNTNPNSAWTGTYPTLMGWNGSSTYGVRVDISRKAEVLNTSRTIAGVAFNGASNISLNNNAITNGAGYTTNTGDITSVTAGNYLSGGGSSGAVTLNVDATVENKPNVIPVRDSGGDINARLFRSEYDVTNASINFIMTQVDTASNNYIRPSTMAQVRASLNVANGATANVGDITSVSAGTGMSGGGTSGAVTLACTINTPGEVGLSNLSQSGNRLSGSFTATGNVTAYSDERLKSEVKTIDNALDKVNALRGVTYVKDGEKGLGVIAQEVEKILPEVVLEGEEYKSVAYGNIVGVLIEAVKELTKEVEQLKSRL